MNKKVENLQDLKGKIEKIRLGDEGFFDEIVVYGQEAIRVMESNFFVEEEKKIAEVIAGAKRMREGDPFVVSRKQKERMWSGLSEGINEAIKKLE